MEWTPIRGPKQSISSYDHTMVMTPLGDFIIEWKSWKDQPSYDITFRDTDWIGCEYSLEEAKDKVKEYLTSKRDELIEYLTPPHLLQHNPQPDQNIT